MQTSASRIKHGDVLWSSEVCRTRGGKTGKSIGTASALLAYNLAEGQRTCGVGAVWVHMKKNNGLAFDKGSHLSSDHHDIRHSILIGASKGLLVINSPAAEIRKMV